MTFWTLFGLASGKATTSWPGDSGSDGQDGVFGMPRYDPKACQESCDACASTCPTHAISREETGLSVDYGRCIVCQLCTEVCPTGAMTPSNDWAFGSRERNDLMWSSDTKSVSAKPESQKAAFRRSLHIRHVDAGSCNGCESELQALNNPFYNLHRFGIFFTPSPRFADLLLVTGPITRAMFEPLQAAYAAMPEPRWVMAVGTCAVSGGLPAGNYACGSGLEGILPVDVYLPGCPPNPAAVIQALLMFLDRVPQRVRGGHVHG
ncbi:NADH:ubiquinone oxidoreductase [Labrys sp. WJW]|uniref:NADH-quinone oxidoreductase subunit NuoB n=1 Tax=Labrys sp. WJW TaxID=1737983 RepID=UPI00082A4554|nr:NADH-quinone oxidoreductase subunit NuoB [Labrys sp. WJW]OCC05450.1 NADH:ubiquinone oxidoreductase [Labrys sp. WJW]